MADEEESLVPPALARMPSEIVGRPPLRRRSPPIASEDELSDNELDELERQLASTAAKTARAAMAAVGCVSGDDGDGDGDCNVANGIETLVTGHEGRQKRERQFFSFALAKLRHFLCVDALLCAT